MTTRIKKDTYSWGALRVIRRNNSYSCVIHPEAFEAIEACDDNGTVDFMDEQGLKWVVTRQGDLVTLVNKTPAGGTKKFTVSFNALR